MSSRSFSASRRALAAGSESVKRRLRGPPEGTVLGPLAPIAMGLVGARFSGGHWFGFCYGGGGDEMSDHKRRGRWNEATHASGTDANLTML